MGMVGEGTDLEAYWRLMAWAPDWTDIGLASSISQHTATPNSGLSAVLQPQADYGTPHCSPIPDPTALPTHTVWGHLAGGSF